MDSIEADRKKYSLKVYSGLQIRPLRLEKVAGVAEVDAVYINNDPRFDFQASVFDPRDILPMSSSLFTTATYYDTYDDREREELLLAHFFKYRSISTFVVVMSCPLAGNYKGILGVNI